jgi:hypothetical protein
MVVVVSASGGASAASVQRLVSGRTAGLERNEGEIMFSCLFVCLFVCLWVAVLGH